MKKIINLLALLTMSNLISMNFDEGALVEGHSKAVTAITFGSKGKTITTGSLDGTIIQRDSKDLEVIRKINNLGAITQVKKIDNFIAVVQSVPIDADSLAHPRPEFYRSDNLAYQSSGAVNAGGGHSKPITDMQIINSKSMVSSDQEGRLVFLYNCMRSVVMDAGTPIDRLTVASPSRTLGLAVAQDKVYTFDPETKNILFRSHSNKEFSEKTGAMTCLVALRHYLLVIGNQDGKVAIFNEKTGATHTEVIKAHQGAVKEVQKINKKLFVTAGQDGVLRVWDTKGCTKAELSSKLKTSVIQSVAAHWDRKKRKVSIAAGYDDGTICMWKTHKIKSI